MSAGMINVAILDVAGKKCSFLDPSREGEFSVLLRMLFSHYLTGVQTQDQQQLGEYLSILEAENQQKQERNRKFLYAHVEILLPVWPCWSE